tara:strand:- start:566 stop:1021 length:456 start_codon:yes stop_codon:yes gene_type:complete
MVLLVSKDTPLNEITLRRYEKPNNLGHRDLIKKLCLSIGLLQPGDSRDIIVDVLYIMLQSKEELPSEEIRLRVMNYREQNKLPLNGVAGSNIRRQLRRMRDIFLLEKIGNKYRVYENADLSQTFHEKLETYLLKSIIERVKEYYRQVDSMF